MDYRIFSKGVACLLAVVALFSCSDNTAVRMRYEAEKLYHQAERQLADVQAKPEQAGAEESTIKMAASSYEKALEYCFEALDSVDSEAHPVVHRELQYLAFQAGNRFSQLHFSARHFEACVGILDGLLKRVSLRDSQLRTTTVNLGQALQASGLWDSALVVYDGAVRRFHPPVDESGEIIVTVLNLPLHTFQVTKAIGDSAAADRYDEAVQYYQNLVAEYPQSEMAASSHALLARLYDQTGRWDDEIAELEALIDTTSETYFDIYLKIADIYATKHKDLERSLSLYRHVLDRVAEADSLRRPSAMFRISMVRMEQGKYDEARGILIEIKRDYPSFYAGMPLAQFTKARSFELQGKWNRAEAEFKYLIEQYRGSEEAMATFLHLADYFEGQGRVEESNSWYQRAEEHFEEIARRGAGTMAEARALAYKADLCYRKGDWPRAAEILSSLFDKFPGSEPGRRGLLKASTIYRVNLNDPERADSLLEVLRSSLVQVDENWET